MFSEKRRRAVNTRVFRLNQEKIGKNVFDERMKDSIFKRHKEAVSSLNGFNRSREVLFSILDSLCAEKSRQRLSQSWHLAFFLTHEILQCTATNQVPCHTEHTFRQLSQLDTKDASKVHEIVNTFPLTSVFFQGKVDCHNEKAAIRNSKLPQRISEQNHIEYMNQWLCNILRTKVSNSNTSFGLTNSHNFLDAHWDLLSRRFERQVRDHDSTWNHRSFEVRDRH